MLHMTLTQLEMAYHRVYVKYKAHGGTELYKICCQFQDYIALRARLVELDRVYLTAPVRALQLKFKCLKLMGSYCANCGLHYHPAALDFHHRDATRKHYNISSMMSAGATFDEILPELRKCEILCSNCHRVEHWNERTPYLRCTVWGDLIEHKRPE